MKAEQQAQVLREVAAIIEHNARPIDAIDVIHCYAGSSLLKYRQVVDLYMLGLDGAGFMKQVIKRAGVELGVKIGEKLLTTYRGVTPRDPYHFRHDEAVYDAEVYVLTPSELKRVVEEAIRAGRNGA